MSRCFKGIRGNNFLVALQLIQTQKGPVSNRKDCEGSPGFPPKKRRNRPCLAQEILTSLRGFRKLNKFRKAGAVCFFSQERSSR